MIGELKIPRGRSMHCRGCGCEMTEREKFIGCDFCYVCAPDRKPYGMKRRGDEELDAYQLGDEGAD